MSTNKTVFNPRGITPSLPTLTVREIKIPPKPIFDSDFLQETETYPKLEQQVVLHCRFEHGVFYSPEIRIWPSTFLKPRYSTEVSRLLHAFNISFYPEWKKIQAGKTHEFTLIFEGLPKGCTSFDLVEEIPEPGGFYIQDITRNLSDVYHIEV